VVTVTELAKAVTVAAAAEPQRMNEGYRYFDSDGNPSCIISQAMTNTGMNFFKPLDERANGKSLWFLQEEGYIELTGFEDTVHWEFLQRVQNLSDWGGMTWARAVIQASRVLLEQ
jgi:hypothetical protein